jgi:hypothetical protein
VGPHTAEAGIAWCHLADDQPVEQHPHRCKLLLYAGRRVGAAGGRERAARMAGVTALNRTGSGDECRRSRKERRTPNLSILLKLNEVVAVNGATLRNMRARNSAKGRVRFVDLHVNVPVAGRSATGPEFRPSSRGYPRMQCAAPL